MWDLLYLIETCNQEKKMGIILHLSQFTLDYVKHQVDMIQKGYKADQYVVQNLNWSVVYLLRITLSNYIIQKVLKLVSLTETLFEFYLDTTTIIISDSYDYLEETLNNVKSINIKSYLVENVADFHAAFIFDSESLESSGYFKPNNLRYINRIFEDTSD